MQAKQCERIKNGFALHRYTVRCKSTGEHAKRKLSRVKCKTGAHQWCAGTVPSQLRLAWLWLLWQQRARHSRTQLPSLNDCKQRYWWKAAPVRVCLGVNCSGPISACTESCSTYLRSTASYRSTKVRQYGHFTPFAACTSSRVL